ncbi:sugar phosphate isomerase/epimerase, partial [Rathayibacter caricis]|nr:sugar phosphate isomerase/epimerase [Rathayibacter caricis]
IGLKNVEAFDFVGRPAEIRAALDASGLAAPTGHAPLLSDELWTPDGSIPTPAPEVVFEAAAQIGIRTVIDPFVPVERWLTEDGVADIADRLNKAAEIAATFGLKV